ACLSWTQPWSAAHDRGRRRAVMRGAKRRIADQRVIRVDQAGDGMNACDLERLFFLERRQNPGQASREHRLAGAGPPAEPHIWVSRCCELERATRAFLPTPAVEVEPPPARLAVDG